MTPVGIVIEDIEAPRLQCMCGGDPKEPLHRFSLLHISWSWKQGDPAPPAHGDYRKFAAR